MTGNTSPLVSIRGVSKAFGPVLALDEVSLDIGSGEFFSLLGPSGCGKTTLLRLLAGFETPSRGSITIDGQDVSLVPANRRPTNMVFQSYAIFPHLNVRDNIGYGLKAKGLDRQAIAVEVEQALETVQLGGYGSRRANQLSGGQRQRVALARALVCRPKVLLLDEPLGALDKKLREQMQVELRHLQEQVGITFVLVTHNQEEALSLSDRIAVMGSGRILQIDTPANVYEKPAGRAVAEFIGAMNVLTGVVRDWTADTLTISVATGATLAAVGSAASVSPGETVVVGIRPEQLVLSVDPPPADWNRLAGVLASETYLGDRRHAYVEVEGLPEPVVVAAASGGRSAATVHPARGAAVWVGWPAGSTLVFPR